MLTPAEQLAKYPVTDRQAQLLRAFAKRPKIKTLRLIAQRMGVQHTNSSYRNIWALMKKGLLAQDPTKRRQSGSYYVTLAGKQWLKQQEAKDGRQAEERAGRTDAG